MSICIDGGCSLCRNWVIIVFIVHEYAVEIADLPRIYAPTDATPTAGSNQGLLHGHLGVGAEVFKSAADNLTTVVTNVTQLLQSYHSCSTIAVLL